MSRCWLCHLADSGLDTRTDSTLAFPRGEVLEWAVEVLPPPHPQKPSAVDAGASRRVEVEGASLSDCMQIYGWKGVRSVFRI